MSSIFLASLSNLDVYAEQPNKLRKAMEEASSKHLNNFHKLFMLFC